MGWYFIWTVDTGWVAVELLIACCCTPYSWRFYVEYGWHMNGCIFGMSNVDSLTIQDHLNVFYLTILSSM